MWNILRTKPQKMKLILYLPAQAWNTHYIGNPAQLCIYLGSFAGSFVHFAWIGERIRLRLQTGSWRLRRLFFTGIFLGKGRNCWIGGVVGLTILRECLCRRMKLRRVVRWCCCWLIRKCELELVLEGLI